MTFFPAVHIWKACTEPKCKFFAWLVMHDKAPTADNLTKKNWPCNLTCSLCFCQPENAAYLLTQCNFTEALWNLTRNQHGLPTYDTLMAAGGPVDWVRSLLISGTAKEKRKRLGVLFSFWWQVWKESNRRIFEGKEKSVPQVANLLKEHIASFFSAAQFVSD
jgi:hypothetical protein